MAARSQIRGYLSLAAVVAVLISAVWLARAHADALKAFIDQHPVKGVLVYIVLNVLDAVLAPGATLPLIPIVSRAWGHVPAALVTTIGWTAGSIIAFFVARRWGAPVVRKLTSMERVRRLRPHVPDAFWSVVLLRLVMPMDAISYVLGLFSEMSWQTYALATALGLTPSAFILAYIGRTPAAYEIIMLGVGAGVVVWLIYSTRRRAQPRRAAFPSSRRHRHARSHTT